MNKRIRKKKRKEEDIFWDELGVPIKNYKELKALNRECQAFEFNLKINRVFVPDHVLEQWFIN